MKRYLLSFILSIGANVHLQAQPPPATEVLREALQQARSEQKNVFIIFHASWCTWCHKMDASMNDPACKQLFESNYIIRHLVVNESSNKKHLENPGAKDFMIRFNGEGQGIPFWLIFDRDGNLLADSKIRAEGDGPEKGENAGCPATEREVAFFIDVLRKTSAIGNEQLEVIRHRFRQND